MRTLLLTLVLACAPAFSQIVPAFEVSVVKENKTGAMAMKSMYDPAGITAVNATMTMLLRQAYSLYTTNDELIRGLPTWAEKRHFDIEARVAPEDLALLKKATPDQRAEMLRGLLRERFKLQARQVKVEQPVYALVVAKSGPKLQVWKPTDVMPNGLPASDARAGGSYSWSDGNLKATGVRLDDLLGVLTQETGRTVLNETGLTGRYDFTLSWTPAENDAAADSGKPVAPGLFTAVQEQLGLRLEQKRGLVDGLIIEHLELPGAN